MRARGHNDPKQHGVTMTAAIAATMVVVLLSSLPLPLSSAATAVSVARSKRYSRLEYVYIQQTLSQSARANDKQEQSTK